MSAASGKKLKDRSSIEELPLAILMAAINTLSDKITSGPTVGPTALSEQMSSWCIESFESCILVLPTEQRSMAEATLQGPKLHLTPSSARQDRSESHLETAPAPRGQAAGAASPMHSENNPEEDALFQNNPQTCAVNNTTQMVIDTRDDSKSSENQR